MIASLLLHVMLLLKEFNKPFYVRLPPLRMVAWSLEDKVLTGWVRGGSIARTSRIITEGMLSCRYTNIQVGNGIDLAWREGLWCKLAGFILHK